MMNCLNCKNDFSEVMDEIINGEYKYCTICGTKVEKVQNPDGGHPSSE